MINMSNMTDFYEKCPFCLEEFSKRSADLYYWNIRCDNNPDGHKVILNDKNDFMINFYLLN